MNPKPPKSILDSTFLYTDAAHTDIRRTFAKVRARLRRDSNPLPGNRIVVSLMPKAKSK